MTSSEIPSTDTSSAPKQRRSTGYVLVILVLLIIVAGLGYSRYQVSSQIATNEASMKANNEAMQAIEAELLKRREETGYLNVQDKTKLNVVAVPYEKDMVWKWKVFVPQGEQLEFGSSISLSNRKHASCQRKLLPGENTMMLVVTHDNYQVWKQQLTVNGHMVSRSIGTALPERRTVEPIETTSSGYVRGVNDTEVFRSYVGASLLLVKIEGAQPPDPIPLTPYNEAAQVVKISAGIRPVHYHFPGD